MHGWCTNRVFFSRSHIYIFQSRTDGWSYETLSELLSLSKEELQSTSSSKGSQRPLVEVLPAIAFKRGCDSPIPAWATHAKTKSLSFKRLSIGDLYEEGTSRDKPFRLPDKDAMVGAGYTHAWLFRAPIVDAPRMLTVRMISREVAVLLVLQSISH